MIKRFSNNKRLRLEAIGNQLIVSGNQQLAKEIDRKGELIEIGAGSEFISQSDDTNDVFLILSGVCEVLVNGRQVAQRGAGTQVGEMAAVQPAQKRSASCIARDVIVAVKLTEDNFTDLGTRYPEIYRSISKELARRLLERNSNVGVFRDKIRVFIISSVEALPIARAIQDAFEHDNFSTVVWTDGVFKVANYTLQDLEDQIDDSDFAVAIAHADDITESREEVWPSPRDNVIFELGLFMGRLGRARAILMEPRQREVKLPSDLAGITTIPYQFEQGKDLAAKLAPACNKLRNHINELGPNNG